MNTQAQQGPDSISESSIYHIRREFFYGPESENAMNDAIGKAQAACAAATNPDTGQPITPVLNFDPNEDIPEGYGIAILPVDRKNPRKGEKQLRVGLGIVAVPSQQLLRASEEPEVVNWVNDMLLQVCLNKVANSIRPREDGSLPSSIPFSLHDFATTTRPQTTAVWNEVAPIMLKALQSRDVSFKGVTKDVFRRLLASAEYAKQTAPTIKQKTWALIIEKMKARAKAMNLQTEIFDNMLRTRDEVTFELTLPELDDLEV